MKTIAAFQIECTGPVSLIARTVSRTVFLVGAHGRVKRIGANVVEVTAHPKLQERVQTLGVKEQRTLAGELRDSIRQYQFALALSLENLLRHTSQLERRGKQFEQAIIALDQRVTAMQGFVASASPQI